MSAPEEEKVVVFEKTSVDAPAPEGDVKLVNTTRTAKYYAKKVTKKEAEKYGVKSSKHKSVKPKGESFKSQMDTLAAKMAGLTLVSPAEVVASAQEEGSSSSQDDLEGLLAGMNIAEEWGGTEGGRRKKTQGVFKRKTRKARKSKKATRKTRKR